MATQPKPWKIIDSSHLADYTIFSIYRVRSESPRTGKVLPFHIIDCGTWINIFPITENGHVVMIRQYRHGTKEITLEIPGGLAEPNEDPADAARREMVEETGYDSDTILPLGCVTPNPAFLTNRCHTFVAPHVSRVRAQSLDRGEDIEVVLIPLHQLRELVSNGTITHSLVVAAIYLLDIYAQKHPESCSWLTGPRHQYHQSRSSRLSCRRETRC